MNEQFYLRLNDTEESWDLLEHDAISDDGIKEDALIARLYDGDARGSALAELIKGFLEEGDQEQDALIEQLAACEHVSWANWMIYLFSKCEFCEDGSYSIPAGLASQWKRQATTAYKDLPEREKQYDRDEVAKILPIIEAYKSGAFRE
jgi:hypothetical protein